MILLEIGGGAWSGETRKSGPNFCNCPLWPCFFRSRYDFRSTYMTSFSSCICSFHQKTVLINLILWLFQNFCISRVFLKFEILMVFHDFLARLPGDPRGAGESPDAEKMGFERYGAAQEGFLSKKVVWIKNHVFFDFNRFPRVPWDPWGYPGIPGTPGDPRGPIFIRISIEKYVFYQKSV